MKQVSWRRCGLYTSVFSLLLLLVSITPSIRPFLFEAAQSQAMRSVLGQGLEARPLVWAVIWFSLVALILHLLLGLIALGLTKLSEVARVSVPERRVGTSFLWFVAVAAAVILRSAAQFPHSHAGGYYGSVAGYEFLGWRVADIVLLSLGAYVLALIAVALARLRPWRSATAYASVAVVAVAVLVWTLVHTTPSIASGNSATGDRPNVIIIGIDSLRADLTQQPAAARNLPHVAATLRQSAWFTDATTPLARTFPAWISILTGRAPESANVVCNLMPRGQVRADPTLATRLGRLGYRSVFATDEVRFSNIDESYGFDQVETPPIGAADFLIPQFSDIPVVNLLGNASVARELLPQLYANRAVSYLYETDSFIDRIRSRVQFDGPTFLAVHLTAPHWPYITADTPVRQPSERPWDDGYADYMDSIRQADGQFGELMHWLEDAGALRNAVVIVLSDHGEAMYRPGDSLLEGVAADELPGVSVLPAGHGTSVLSPSQFQVVLGFRGFGPSAGAVRPGIRNYPASLEDIVPTLASIVGLRDSARTDGESLAAVLAMPATATERVTRARFTETGFNVEAMKRGGFKAEEIAAQGAWHYQVSPASGYVELRPGSTAYVKQHKEYAVIEGDWLLAALPDVGSGSYVHVLARRDGSMGKVVASLNDHPELPELSGALVRRFGPAVRLAAETKLD